jgi:hypothetical protein
LQSRKSSPVITPRSLPRQIRTVTTPQSLLKLFILIYTTPVSCLLASLPKHCTKIATQEPSLVVHICNPCTQEDHEFQATLGYVVRSCFKRKEVAMQAVTHIIPSSGWWHWGWTSGLALVRQVLLLLESLHQPLSYLLISPGISTVAMPPRCGNCNKLSSKLTIVS